MGFFSRLLGSDPRSDDDSDRHEPGQSPTVEQADDLNEGQLFQGVEAPGLLLKKKEICYCAADAALMEEKVKKKRIKGRSMGASVRLSKGFTIRGGTFDGEIVPESAIVPTSIGKLFITNQRIVFLGNNKSLNIRLGSLLGIQLFTDGIRLTDARGNPKVLKMFSEEDVRDVKGVLSGLFEGTGLPRPSPMAAPTFEINGEEHERTRHQDPKKAHRSGPAFRRHQRRSVQRKINAPRSPIHPAPLVGTPRTPHKETRSLTTKGEKGPFPDGNLPTPAPHP